VFDSAGEGLHPNRRERGGDGVLEIAGYAIKTAIDGKQPNLIGPSVDDLNPAANCCSASVTAAMVSDGMGTM
jgi:hypothetical protein